MSDWKHHKLKRARLNARTIIDIPEDWSFGHDETKDRFWCGREDDDVTLFVQSVVLNPQDGGFAKAIDGNVAHTVRFLSDLLGLQGDVNIRRPSPREACVHAVVDHDEDGTPFRTFRWYFFRRVDAETIAHLRFLLSMPSAASDEPACRELVDIFAEQMANIVTGDPMEDPLWARVHDWRNLPEAERVGCRRDWHRLRIFKPFGFIRLLAPEGWPVDEWDAHAEMWCLCDEPDDEATLWIDYDIYSGAAPASLEALAQGVESARPRDVEDRGRLRHASGGIILRSVQMAEENGEILRIFRWDMIAAVGQAAISAFFSLAISRSSQDTPDEALLVRIFDEELPNCEIGAPPRRHEAAIGS